MNIKKAWAYLWDMKNRRIEKLEAEARHPYAKVFDNVFNNPLVGIRRLVSNRKKDLGKHN